MPYINQERRFNLTEGGIEPVNSGELNYLITTLCDKYLNEKGVSYSNMNDIVGALECAKLEFYRRIAEPYEDVKRLQNGEVYTIATATS